MNHAPRKLRSPPPKHPPTFATPQRPRRRCRLTTERDLFRNLQFDSGHAPSSSPLLLLLAPHLVVTNSISISSFSLLPPSLPSFGTELNRHSTPTPHFHSLTLLLLLRLRPNYPNSRLSPQLLNQDGWTEGVLYNRTQQGCKVDLNFPLLISVLLLTVRSREW